MKKQWRRLINLTGLENSFAKLTYQLRGGKLEVLQVNDIDELIFLVLYRFSLIGFRLKCHVDFVFWKSVDSEDFTRLVNKWIGITWDMEFVCQYDVREILGQGSFSEVKRCIDKRTRQAFAVKEIAYDTAKRRDKIEQEIKVSLLPRYDRTDRSRCSAVLPSFAFYPRLMELMMTFKNLIGSWSSET